MSFLSKMLDVGSRMKDLIASSEWIRQYVSIDLAQKQLTLTHATVQMVIDTQITKAGLESLKLIPKAPGYLCNTKLDGKEISILVVPQYLRAEADKIEFFCETPESPKIENATSLQVLANTVLFFTGGTAIAQSLLSRAIGNNIEWDGKKAKITWPNTTKLKMMVATVVTDNGLSLRLEDNALFFSILSALGKNVLGMIVKKRVGTEDTPAIASESNPTE
jgi:hypothetical protein